MMAWQHISPEVIVRGVKKCCISSAMDETDNTGQEKNFFLLLPGKIKGDLYRFDIAESKYDNQNLLPPTTFKGERFKVKNYVFD